MEIAFVKMHGIGNDAVIIDGRGKTLHLDEVLVRAIADRRRGVGCDQLILIEKPKRSVAAAAVRFWNADGGEIDACGNGSRCVAARLMTESGTTALDIETKAGLLHCRAAGENRVVVDMGKPKLDWQEIPLAERMDTRKIDIKVGPIDAPVLFGPSAVNMGNPHCIFFVDNVEAYDLARLGPMLEHHPMFPERANISLAQVNGPDAIRLRVWERGAGLTLACGTAACAVVVAAARRGLADRRADVTLDGGTLSIEWRESDDHVLMTGPVALSFTGSFSPEGLLSGVGTEVRARP
jgi:diaminopimelate epimerase